MTVHDLFSVFSLKSNSCNFIIQDLNKNEFPSDYPKALIEDYKIFKIEVLTKENIIKLTVSEKEADFEDFPLIGKICRVVDLKRRKEVAAFKKRIGELEELLATKESQLKQKDEELKEYKRSAASSLTNLETKKKEAKEFSLASHVLRCPKTKLENKIESRFCVLSVANYIIQYAEDHEYKITNMKLNRILYYVYGYYGAIFNQKLFHEDFQAWKYGPVAKSVYVEYLTCGSLNIWANDINPNYPPAKFSDKEQKVVNKVLEDKLKMSGGELVDATRKEDPWKCHEHEINPRDEYYANKPHIKFEEMQEYFKQLPDVKQLKAEIFKENKEQDCISNEKQSGILKVKI